jgi:hypothetical protein
LPKDHVKKSIERAISVLTLAGTLAIPVCATVPDRRPKTLATLDPRSRELFLTNMKWSDQNWDDRAALLRVPAPRTSPNAPPSTRHGVRDTSWYIAGLLLRDQPGDRARAIRGLNAVLEQQIRDPGSPWDGTFYRTAEEPQPPLWPQMWTDYDPNWRAFIGTTLAIILSEYEQRLPAELCNRIDNSIRRAVNGELKEGRLKPSYTSVAIMHGFLWAYAGTRLKRQDWVTRAEEWAKTIYDGYKQTNTFEEYNSPTYYGVDLYGLALWRVYGPTDNFRRMGAEMEAGLWRDLAAHYHAGLKNLAGPYDRSYGIDMRRYVSLTGLWLRTVLDKNAAPFPDPGGPFELAGDFVFTPSFVTLGTRIPPDAMRHFQEFRGERQVNRNLTRGRVATAWIGKDLMLGGEFTGKSKAAGTARNTFIPATVHWKTPGGDVGSIYLAEAPRVDARAQRDMLTISAIGDSTFRISAPGLEPKNVDRNTWTLPGLNVRVETDATGFNVSRGSGYVDVVYKDATKFVLRVNTQPR